MIPFESTSAMPARKARVLTRRNILRCAIAFAALLVLTAVVLAFVNDGYRRAGQGLFIAAQFLGSGAIHYVLPFLALSACGWFYFSEVRRAMRERTQAFPWTVVAPAALVLILGVSSLAFETETPATLARVPNAESQPKDILILPPDSPRAERLALSDDSSKEASKGDLAAALQANRFKLVCTPGRHGPVYRLYDLATDEACLRDVKEQYPVVYERMKTAVLEWRDEHKHCAVTEIYSSDVEFPYPAVEAKPVILISDISSDAVRAGVR
jgi:hypothetical protein